MKKSALKVFYMFMASNEDVLLNFETCYPKVKLKKEKIKMKTF